MDWEQLELNPRIIAAVKKANLRSARDILSLSGPDIQRLTHLSKSDVQHLHKAVAVSYRRLSPVTALQVHRGECPSLDPGHKLSLACPVLDSLLRGGVPLAGITELAGESSAGKTQLGLQLCLSVQYPLEYGGLNSGAVYICTEDSFPIKRLRQLISQQPRLRSELPPALIRRIRFSDNVYIEHAADLGALQACISQRVPILLSRGLVRLVVLDSVTALFRSEFQADEGMERARQMSALAATLHRLSHNYSAPVLCINQVTDVMDGPDPANCNFGLVDNKVRPALGMAWANQVMVRLMLLRLPGYMGPRSQGSSSSSAPRRLEVVFAPHLPRASCLCGVWEEGVRGLTSTEPGDQEIKVLVP
ncbi:DNA repair protein XRCC3 [Esox lucius]|uniref:DNA repair protein n=1 Tax=Esox lucius TaxID=8010 RepID=A0A3P8XPJ6_ESOLU|nr:DNA repair protein XRCC3 [Esox lucius]XP_010880725.1 DNA repair protein XRCC3 [Esox lucius]XP_010880727.1 DNA repair protein XRCC3 [Esox lucius]XP_010880728.1 DNA repair protein XRCC3 [Esox lucius]XP_010880729.1 DNA repair protein XRCC3 [Esox lucius]XP_028970247.1 DNA repair protein XRCC3 [Esox lucius]